MVHSPLTNKILRTSKYSSRQGLRIRRAIVHHWAGIYGGVERLVYSREAASANYIILSDGTLISSVPEEFRAWTSGSFTADGCSVTIEIQNETLGPEYRVSAAAQNTVMRLLADLARRYQWGAIRRGIEVRGHHEFQNTNCPGPYVWPRLSTLADQAQSLLTTGKTPTGNTGTTSSAGVQGDPGVYAWQVDQNRYGNAGLVEDGSMGPRSQAWKTWVKALQQALRTAPGGSPTLTIDGSYGPATQACVRSIQRAGGLLPDGIAGPATTTYLQTLDPSFPNRPVYDQLTTTIDIGETPMQLIEKTENGTTTFAQYGPGFWLEFTDPGRTVVNAMAKKSGAPIKVTPAFWKHVHRAATQGTNK